MGKCVSTHSPMRQGAWKDSPRRDDENIKTNFKNIKAYKPVADGVRLLQIICHRNHHRFSELASCCRIAEKTIKSLTENIK